MNPAWFNIAWKTGAYAIAGMYTVGMNAGAVGLWIYEKKTGKDVPFLLEVPIIVLSGAATAGATASLDEAITRIWQRYGYTTTVRVLRTPKIGLRSLARGTVRLVTSGGARVVPIIGAAFFAHNTITHYGSYHHFFSSLGHEVREESLAMPMISPF